MTEVIIQENWKEKYYQAVVDQDYREQQNTECIETLYKELIRALHHYRGQDSAIDEAISGLPKKPNLADIPFEALKRLNYQISSMVDSPDRLLEEQPNQSRLQAPKVDPCAFAKELLQDLVEKLPVAVMSKIDPHVLESTLSESGDINDLRTVNNEIEVALTDVVTSQDKQIAALSSFLCATIERLDGFKTHFKEEKIDRETSSNEREKLGDFLGVNLKEIRASVAEFETIEQLQLTIDSHIDEINSEITHYVQQEFQRAEKAEKSSIALEAKLEELHFQTNQLRESLEAARAAAIIDPLTNISNRRAYDERFEIEYTRWKRYREPLTLAIIDIDHFKRINDVYGHPIGDKVLQTVAERIQGQVRESDFFGRIGGEEFAFILVNSDLESSMTKVEALRRSIEHCKFTVKTEELQVTISIGVATFKDGDTIDAIYQRADKALIKAKKTGRNKSLSERDMLP